MSSVKVQVPASSANLGPGFDALGLAFNLYNYVTVEAAVSRDSVCVLGDGLHSLPTNGDNIALIAARHLTNFLGINGLHFQLTLENAIPLSRGLGSSAAA